MPNIQQGAFRPDGWCLPLFGLSIRPVERRLLADQSRTPERDVRQGVRAMQKA
ncbi:hypothetical protein [Paraburkholderia heleia]|uniref:hypothetical protein n=1 Tax=Paraburkholderia heleia TaxID=634127 RepID=UPI000B3182B0|nr:hypothetical protein [Paraburkholderia heleia]